MPFVFLSSVVARNARGSLSIMLADENHRPLDILLECSESAAESLIENISSVLAATESRDDAPR